FSSRRRHTRFSRDWSSDVCSSDLRVNGGTLLFDTNNYVDINDTFTATASHAVVPTSGQPRNLGFHEYESSVDVFTTVVGSTDKRSEERRVGKECRARVWTEHEERQ